MWNKRGHNSELVTEFIHFVQDSLEEQASDQRRYKLPDNEYIPPEDTAFL